jgi:hypothetical protein
MAVSTQTAFSVPPESSYNHYMGKSVIITGRGLSLDELAAEYGISKRRQAELLAMVARIKERSRLRVGGTAGDITQPRASKHRSNAVRKKAV